MNYIPVLFHPKSIESLEKARDVLQKQRLVVVVSLIASNAIIALFYLSLHPKLTALFQDMNRQLPISTQLVPAVLGIATGISLLSLIYFLTTKPNYSRLDSVLDNLRKGELVHPGQLLNPKLIWLPLSYILITVIYLTTAFILPIYNLIGN